MRQQRTHQKGLLREDFPKGLDLATVTNAEVQAAADQLTNRPRKRTAS
jgi:IS30 family transposase